MLERSQRTGDAVHEIISNYSAMVYRLAYARTGNRADAEDVYQDVFFKLFRNQPEFENDEHLRAWLIRTTIHTSVNLLRSAWRRYFKPMPENYDAPDPAVAGSEQSEELHAALCKLPEKQRIAIHLYYYEDYSTDEIASLTSENPSSVRSQLKRGRERLYSLLKSTEVK